ncbi:MAG: precorrin-6y C5,15-methyltransferase (decarboxylating) subunit CbiE [Candidatus Schekmanbacteria bacterium]|nr:precorrin-6y C5,15-methyltransferase (decarboxylating) subunit CbiE [Candidatus Schekmanbacteria bacterium]
MSHPVYLVSMGPGHEDYISPCAWEAINHADLLVGARRWLQVVAHLKKPQALLGGSLDEVINLIKSERQDKKIAVLLSGDAGLYSLLPRLRDALGADALEVIPGISSVQLAFARLKLNWERACVLSLHGRSFDGLAQEMAGAAVTALLSDAQHPPACVAEYLRKMELIPQAIYVCQHLSYADERIVKTDLEGLAQVEAGDNFLLILEF